MKKFENFEEFWPFYLSQHSKPATRMFHFIGTLIMFILFTIGLLQLNWMCFLTGIVTAYFLAWFSHFIIEKNHPATFNYPVKSIRGDLTMFWKMLTGTLKIK